MNFTQIYSKPPRALRYPNVKMKKRFEPDYGSGATGFPPEDTDTGESMRRLSPEEQDLLMKIFQLKREIRVSIFKLCLYRAVCPLLLPSSRLLIVA